MSALDFPAIAAALGMRGTCTIHLGNPVEGEQIARYQTPAGEVPEPPIRWVSLAAELPVR